MTTLAKARRQNMERIPEVESFESSFPMDRLSRDSLRYLSVTVVLTTSFNFIGHLRAFALVFDLLGQFERLTFDILRHQYEGRILYP